MLQASKYIGQMLPSRHEANTPQKQYAGVDPAVSRSTISRHYESPMAMAKQNHVDQSRRSRGGMSPIKGAMQDLPTNQYDSVMVNSRLDEIRRKYDGHLKRFQEPHTPLRDLSNASMRQRDLQLASFEKPRHGSELKSHSMSRATLQSKQINRTNESVVGSAIKQRESDFLADQVKQIRTSFKMQESKKSRSLCRNSSMFDSGVPSFGRSNERTLEDPRVESIDKINLKIKEILNCLNDNEKNIGQGGPPATSRYNQPADLMIRDRDLKELPFKNNRSTNPILSTKPQSKVSQSFISNGQNSRQSFIAKPYENIERKQDVRRYSMYTYKPTDTKFERAQSIIPMKNSIMTNKRPESSSSMTKSSNGDYILSSGKDLDEEIRKIQEKIRLSEEEKRRLDIKFQSKHQELGVAQRKIVPVIIVHQPSQNITDQTNQKSIEQIQVPKLSQHKFSTRKNLTNIEESPSFKQLPVFRDNSRSKEILRSVMSGDNLSIQNISAVGNQNTTNVANVTKFSLDGKDTSKQDLNSRYYGYRRPVPDIPKTINVDLKHEPQSPKGVQTKRLVDHLKQQVVYDEELRNSKLNFAALQDPTKWVKLSDELKKHGIGFSQGQLKVQFELSLQEHNPFYSVRQTQQPIDSVAKKYVVSHNYWNKQICRNFSQNDLENELFLQDRVDLQRKGYLTVEDFVRFLNIETGTFYRNRDLILIFRRMSVEPRLTFNAFMKVVCR